MNKNKHLIQKVKHALLKCYLISAEKKQTLLAELPFFSDKQLAVLLTTVKKYEEQAEPFIQEGFQSNKGAELYQELKNIFSNLKRKTYKQLEKENQVRHDHETQLLTSLNQI